MTDVVYIMGHGLSGSTLLALLLGSHPDIATVGETAIAPRSPNKRMAFTCSCHAAYHDCAFWQDVTRAMAERGYDFDIEDSGLVFRAPDRPLVDALLRFRGRGAAFEALRDVGLMLAPGARRTLAALKARNRDFIEVVTRLRGARVFLDGSKRPERALYLRRTPGLSVKVIHLVRDGRAVACSAMKNWSMPAEEAARLWTRTNRHCLRARPHFAPDSWLMLRYEDLCAEPAGVMQMLHRFIGVEPQPAPTDFRAGQHIIGNRMRLASTTEIRLDERWKTALSPADLATIERHVTPLNRRFGYLADDMARAFRPQIAREQA
ncbi:MAG TPA: sulfotransferase [Azospirillum sp.]|nr:sulfotransferase [Azospirillum sp.]